MLKSASIIHVDFREEAEKEAALPPTAVPSASPAPITARGVPSSSAPASAVPTHTPQQAPERSMWNPKRWFGFGGKTDANRATALSHLAQHGEGMDKMVGQYGGMAPKALAAGGALAGGLAGLIAPDEDEDGNKHRLRSAFKGMAAGGLVGGAAGRAVKGVVNRRADQVLRERGIEPGKGIALNAGEQANLQAKADAAHHDRTMGQLKRQHETAVAQGDVEGAHAALVEMRRRNDLAGEKHTTGVESERANRGLTVTRDASILQADADKNVAIGRGAIHAVRHTDEIHSQKIRDAEAKRQIQGNVAADRLKGNEHARQLTSAQAAQSLKERKATLDHLVETNQLSREQAAADLEAHKDMLARQTRVDDAAANARVNDINRGDAGATAAHTQRLEQAAAAHAAKLEAQGFQQEAAALRDAISRGDLTLNNMRSLIAAGHLTPQDAQAIHQNVAASLPQVPQNQHGSFPDLTSAGPSAMAAIIQRATVDPSFHGDLMARLPYLEKSHPSLAARYRAMLGATP